MEDRQFTERVEDGRRSVSKWPMAMTDQGRALGSEEGEAVEPCLVGKLKAGDRWV